MVFKFLKQSLGLIICICALNSDCICSTNSSSDIHDIETMTCKNKQKCSYNDEISKLDIAVKNILNKVKDLSEKIEPISSEIYQEAKKNDGSWEMYRAIEEIDDFVNLSYIEDELNDALTSVHNMNKAEGQKCISRLRNSGVKPKLCDKLQQIFDDFFA